MTDKQKEIDESRKKQMQQFKQNKVKEQEIFHPVNLTGLTTQRQSTDQPYSQIVIFIVIGFLAIGGYAYFKGNIQKILPLKDYQGNTCGFDKKEKFDKLYFQSTNEGWKSICVNKCPAMELKSWDSYYEQYDKIQIKNSYETTQLFEHLCIPKDQKYQEELGLKQII